MVQVFAHQQEQPGLTILGMDTGKVWGLGSCVLICYRIFVLQLDLALGYKSCALFF